MVEDGPITIRRKAARFASDERAATAIEYGLICCLVIIVIVGSIHAVSDSLMDSLWNKVADAMSTAAPSGS